MMDVLVDTSREPYVTREVFRTLGILQEMRTVVDRIYELHK
jgi:hypothetical protein